MTMINIVITMTGMMITINKNPFMKTAISNTIVQIRNKEISNKEIFNKEICNKEICNKEIGQ